MIVSGSAGYNTTDPTSSQIADWNTGWGASNTTGWNYVGQVNGASAVYLGNNWVITAGHVGAGTFSLDGTNYNMLAGSAKSVSNSAGTADLNVFELVQGPSLPSIAVATSPPTGLSTTVAMIGYGGGQGETWGLNTVTQTGATVGLDGFLTTDFETEYGSFELAGGTVITNDAMLVSDDSGGGDFTYDSSMNSWVLEGINEAVDGNQSYMVQLSTYSSQIDQIIAVPEPNCSLLAGLTLAALLSMCHRAKKRQRLQTQMP